LEGRLAIELAQSLEVRLAMELVPLLVV